MNLFDEFYSEQEKLIQAGQGFRVHANIKYYLRKNTILNSQRGKIGQLYRRIGSPLSTLKILNKLIYSDNVLHIHADSYDLLQYGSALIAVGANEEGRRVLSSISDSQQPEKNLYLATSLFYQWKYDEAIPLLESFISNPKLSLYQTLLGKVNLASAYAAVDKDQQAIALAQEVFEYANKNLFFLLKGFSLEILAEAYINLKDFKKSHEFLKKAEDHLKESSSLGSLWINKWKAILLAMENKKKLGLQMLRATRILAKEKGEWETHRECDLFDALFTNNKKLFLKVYFGSPFDSYRKRALATYSKPVILPPYFDWGFEHSNSQATFFFESEKFYSTPLLKKLLETLTQDFYKPVRTAQIHESLYPNIAFQPFFSAKRIYDLVRRLKIELKPLGIGIEKSNFGYWLTAKKGVHLRKRINSIQGLKHEEVMHWIQIQKSGFQTKDLISQFEISKSSALRIIKDKIEDRTIEKFGSGTNTVYYPLKNNSQ